MSGTLGFIFNGQPVPPQPTGSDTQSSFPGWQQQFVENLANAATNLGSQQYTPFPGPTVAAPSAQTQQAEQLAGSNVGSWQPALNQAMSLEQQAGQGVDPSQVSQFMNPYMNQVIGGLTSASNTNFFQNQLPGIQAQFVGAGQSRSPQEMQATNNALYQNNQALNQGIAGALGQGYQGALNASFQNQGLKQAAGATSGQLGALTSQLGAQDVGQLAASGATQDQYNQSNINSALNQFYAQQQWPYQNLAYASNILRGQNIPTNTQTVGQNYSPGQSYTASPLASFVGGTLGSSALGNSVTSLRKGGKVEKKAPKRVIGALAAHRVTNDNHMKKAA
jgi:hypothetical protein